MSYYIYYFNETLFTQYLTLLSKKRESCFDKELLASQLAFQILEYDCYL